MTLEDSLAGTKQSQPTIQIQGLQIGIADPS